MNDQKAEISIWNHIFQGLQSKICDVIFSNIWGCEMKVVICIKDHNCYSVLSATTFRNLNLGYVMPHLLAYKVAKWASPSSKISPQKWYLLFKRWTLISQVIIFDHSLKTGRTYVYSLGCIFLIGCPNMTMFNTLICMDIHGEQIKRQEIPLQISFSL